MSFRRAAWCAIATAAALLALPASGVAAVTLGATNMGDTSAIYANSDLDLTVSPRSPGPGLQVEAPASGVVVLWRVRLSTAANPVLRLRVLRRVGANVTAVRSGGPARALNGLNEFPSRVPISAGDNVGFDLPRGIGLPYRAATGSTWGMTNPPLADGATAGETTVPGEIVFQAVVEPDADRDTFGDETQDACPRLPGPAAGCPAPPGATPGPPPATAPDTTAPRLTGDVAVRPRRLAPGRGASFGFSLSEPARVTVAIQRATRGQRVNGRCVPVARRHRSRPVCIRWAHVGTLQTDGVAGANGLAWTGLLRGRALSPASYRAVFVATDAAGNVGPRRTAPFTVVAPARRAR